MSGIRRSDFAWPSQVKSSGHRNRPVELHRPIPEKYEHFTPVTPRLLG